MKRLVILTALLCSAVPVAEAGTCAEAQQEVARLLAFEQKACGELEQCRKKRGGYRFPGKDDDPCRIEQNFCDQARIKLAKARDNEADRCSRPRDPLNSRRTP